MPLTLNSRPVWTQLSRLHERARVEDAEALARVQTREQVTGRRLTPVERYQLYGDAPLAITPEVGQLLYVLTLAHRPTRVVEFGSSLGVSTIYLAAALADNGLGGSLITTEQMPEKAAAALRHVGDAGLGELVEMRVGDARETLLQVADRVDMVFLDGRNDLYLAVLHLLEPNLAPQALVIADLSRDDPALADFTAYVRAPGNGYASVTVPLGHGVEVSVRRQEGLSG